MERSTYWILWGFGAGKLIRADSLFVRTSYTHTCRWGKGYWGSTYVSAEEHAIDLNVRVQTQNVSDIRAIAGGTFQKGGWEVRGPYIVSAAMLLSESGFFSFCQLSAESSWCVGDRYLRGRGHLQSACSYDAVNCQ
jgi:hypothetical protein